MVTELTHGVFTVVSDFSMYHTEHRANKSTLLYNYRQLTITMVMINKDL
jgi:hypothetical protein